MKHKCDGCKYSGEHQEMGVCYKEHSLIEAAKAYEADKCPFAKPMTNFDRIKAMSVKEMANFLMVWAVDCMTGKAPMDVRKWLESEVQEDEP